MLTDQFAPVENLLNPITSRPYNIGKKKFPPIKNRCIFSTRYCTWTHITCGNSRVLDFLYAKKYLERNKAKNSKIELPPVRYVYIQILTIGHSKLVKLGTYYFLDCKLIRSSDSYSQVYIRL